MKLLPIFISILFLSCESPKNEISGSQLSVIDYDLSPREFEHDTINKHPYEIPFWEYSEENNWFSDLEPGLTKLRFSNFTFKIAGEMWRTEDESRDTLTISEDVGYYLEGRDMWIEGQDTSDRFELYMSVQQSIHEQYDYKNHDRPDFDWDEWEKNRVKLDIRSDFYKVRDSAGIYRLPWAHVQGQFFENRFNQQFDYIDTTRHMDGEMGATATHYIQNKFCVYWNDFAMFKIVKTAKDGTVTNHYFKLWYSYGC